MAAENQQIPQFDIPVDYVMSNDITAPIVNQYGSYPCRIQAAIVGVVVRGELSARVNLQEYDVHAGEIFFLIPNSFIMLKKASEDALISIIGFSSEFTERSNIMRHLMPYYNVVAAHPVLKASEGVSKIMCEAIDLLVHAQELPETPLNSEMMINIIQLIWQIMAPAYTQLQQGGQNNPHMNRSEQIARDFSLLVMKNYTSEHRVNYYAEQLHLCLPYLCSVIKEETGQTATQIINRAIITDAKSQLKATDAQIKNIAFSLGFDNVSFFNKFFKLQTGMTPKQYRES